MRTQIVGSEGPVDCDLVTTLQVGGKEYVILALGNPVMVRGIMASMIVVRPSQLLAQRSGEFVEIVPEEQAVTEPVPVDKNTENL